MTVDGMIQAVRGAVTMDDVVAALRGGVASSDPFKNSAVKDAAGNLLTVYHGTENDFEISEFRDNGLNAGIYFTDSREMAGGFAGNGGRVIEAQLALTNPIDLTSNPDAWEDFHAGQDYVRELREQGYDGAIFKEPPGDFATGNETVYVAFDKNQIRTPEKDGEGSAAGESLTPDERQQALASLVDVYRDKGLAKEPRVNDRGEEYYAYPHSPDLFETSDITGRQVRYYITLPDGRIAHPTELFPSMTEARVAAMAEEKATKAGQAEAELDRHLGTTFASMAEAASHWDDKSDASLASSGRRTVLDSLNRVPVTDGERVALIPADVFKSRRAEIEARGWRQGEPEVAADQDEGFLSSYSEDDLAERERQQQAAQETEQRQREEEERRAQADRDRDDFRLSGSNSASDVAASYGQSDMLGAMSAPPPDDEPELGQVEPDDFPGPKGKEMEVKTAKGTKVDTRFTVLEASELIASHTPDGRENAAFPQELQPRDRTRDSSRAWVQKVAKDLDPGLLGKTKKADSGAPIIGKDRIVESGNGRTLAIMEAYRLGTADEYKAWLVEDADSYGLNPSQIAGMTAPVLVRVRSGNLDRAAFAVEANQDDKLAMTATEKAKADANRLTPELLSRFDPGADGDMLTASNRDFIMGFLRSLGDAEAAQYLTSTGEFTGPLIARVQAAVFAKAYEDERLLELMADSAKPENRNIISALSAAAPEFIQARAANAEGTQDASEKLGAAVELSLEDEAVKSLIDATNIVRQAKREGMDVGEYVSQMGLFGDVDPGVAAMAVFIAQNNRSAKRLSTAFKAMADFVRAEMERDNAAAGDIFGEAAKVSMADVVEAANRVMEAEYGEGQYQINAPSPGGLFESTPTPELLRVDIDAAAAVTEQNPTPAQVQAGNYRKGKASIHGMTIAIENPQGSTRRGVDPDGKEWESTMAHHYGDIKGTVGADGDSLDVFIGDSPAARAVYVIDQVGGTGQFDEHKVMLGFDSMEAAREGYLANYESGWRGLGKITRVSLDGFKDWLRNGSKRHPFRQQQREGLYEGVRDIRHRALARYLILG